MNSPDVEPSAITKFDPELTERLMGLIRPVIKGGTEQKCVGSTTSRPAARSWWRITRAGCSPWTCRSSPPTSTTFGYGRGVYTLSHDILFTGPTGDLLKRTGFIPASHENADEALRAGGVVVVFPGGDYDVYRPTGSENTIDFNGRTGYVRAALNAGVPIVPSVSIGGQENQLFLSRGEWLAKALRMDKLLRVKILPISFGFPFGLSAILPEPAAANQDRHAGATAHRRRCRVRRRPRHRRGRRPRSGGHAAGTRRAGRRTPTPRDRLTMLERLRQPPVSSAPCIARA